MPVQEINISKITANEIDQLRSISILTFTETFSEQNTEADMQKYIQERLSIHQLTSELNTTDSEFYFLRVDHEVAGYLKLNSGKAQTEKQKGNTLEIERIYVSSKYHSKGFGKLLLNQSIDVARQKGFDCIWLGVWENNFRAISFYKKNGFEQFDTHVFTLGEDEQTDILMKLELK